MKRSPSTTIRIAGPAARQDGPARSAPAANDGFRPLVSPWICYPLMLLALAVFSVPAADLWASGLFFRQGQWVFLDSQPWKGLYQFGVFPALGLAGAGLIVGLAGWWYRPWRAWRSAGWCLALAMVLGPGLLVNGLLKPGWTRPRPNQVVQFGGTLQFRPIWMPHPNPDARSFPSGHASMGFFLIVPALLLRRRWRRLAQGLLGLGVSYGLLMGLGRVAQGRHFASDVVCSGVFIYLVALGLTKLLAADKRLAQAAPRPEPQTAAAPRAQKAA